MTMTDMTDTNADRIIFCKPISTVPNILFIDGLARSGKSTLCQLITTLKRIEIERIDMIHDYVGMLHAFGKLDHDAAIAMSRMYADLSLYDNYIGRNANFRWRDASSVFRSPRMLTYIHRLFSQGKEQAIAEIETEQPILLNHTHNQLENINFHCDSFPDTLRVITIVRHPINLAYAWWKTGHGENLCQSKWNQIFCISRNDSPPAHYLASGWEHEFQTMTPIDRIIRMHFEYMVRARHAVETLSENRKGRVLQIRNTTLFQIPEKVIISVAAFLDTQTTNKSKAAIKKLLIAKDRDSLTRDTCRVEIFNACSARSRDLLNEMENIYESQSYSL